jgi:Fe-S-cluster containining protein
MKYLTKIVREVERLYTELDRDALQFRGQTGLKCPSGCSSCCSFKNIRASVLEMMPLAWHLFQNDQYEEVVDRLDHASSACVLYRYLDSGEGLGGCLHYDQRPLICRLFGNAGIHVKRNNIAMYTCQIMKTRDPQLFQEAMKRIQLGLEIPMAQHYQTRLDVIDFTLASELYPINQSIRKALEKVSFHFRGNPQPGDFRKVG